MAGGNKAAIRGGLAAITLLAVLFPATATKSQVASRGEPTATPAATRGPVLRQPADPFLRQGRFEDADRAHSRSRLPADGDLQPRPEIPAPADGVLVAPGDTGLPDDGLDPQAIDQRPSAERDEFSYDDSAGTPGPPDDAGLLFQIEDLAPASPEINRRPARFAELDPYTPTGIKLGTFILFPEIELTTVWNSNVFSSPVAQSDTLAEFQPTVRLISDWSNHALEFRAAGDLSAHSDFSSEDDRAYDFGLRGRIDITRRTTAQGSITRSRAQEDRSAIDAATAGDRASVTTQAVAAAFNHRFNRLSVQLRGGVTDTADSDTGFSRDRDTLERRMALRGSWEFKPDLRAFGEVEGNDREFEAASIVDGRRRDSDGLRLRGGISFGETSETLRGEVSVGYARQDLADPLLEDAEGAIIDANLAWRVTGLTSLLFTAASDISSVTRTNGSGAALERRVGLEARHAFRRHLIGSAAIQPRWRWHSFWPRRRPRFRAARRWPSCCGRTRRG